MVKILEPKIKQEDLPAISIQADIDNESGVNKILEEWPRRVPIVQINDYVLQVGQLLDFSVFTGNENGSSSVPTFRMKVEDNNYLIQESLANKKIDTVNISFGLKDMLIKFVGIITSMSIRTERGIIYLYGVWYNEKLYNSEQKLFTNKSLKDILMELCDSAGLGLFTYDNDEITKPIDKVLNPDLQQLEFIQQIISRYSTNVYCFDIWGYLHLGHINEIIKKPLDKYSFNQESAEKEELVDIIFRINKNIKYPNNEAEIKKLNRKINVTNYSITNDFSMSKINLASKYNLFTNDCQSVELISDNTVGLSSDDNDNTFYGFKTIPEAPDTRGQKFPFRNERIAKMLIGNKLELELESPIFELTPYSLVGVEMYHELTAENATNKIRKDKEHSGKYLVLSIEYKYKNNSGKSSNQVTQTIKLFRPESIQTKETEDEPIVDVSNENVQKSTVTNTNIVSNTVEEENTEKTNNSNRKSTAGMHVSERLLKHLQHYEGCVLTAYQCAASKWTIGYGHTLGVKPGMKITKAQALSYLRQDIAYFENAVKKQVKQATQGEFDALVSICFNMGAGGIARTGLYDYHNKMSPVQTAKKITRTAITAKGKVLNGLVSRRLKESQIYSS